MLLWARNNTFLIEDVVRRTLLFLLLWLQLHCSLNLSGLRLGMTIVALSSDIQLLSINGAHHHHAFLLLFACRRLLLLCFFAFFIAIVYIAAKLEKRLSTDTALLLLD